MADDTLIHVKDLAGRLRFVDLRGSGPLWAPETGPGRSSHIATRSQLTTAGHQLRATVEAMDARLVIIDSLAGAYASDENIRALVPGVLRRLGRLGQPDTLRRHADRASPENGRRHRGGGP